MMKVALALAVACLSMVPAATAQKSEALTFGDLQEAINDPDGNAAQLAKGLLGDHGGNRLFYIPTRDQPATPDTWGCKYENVNFQAKDGTPLHGWFIPAVGKTAKGTIVFSHGNAGSVGHHLGFVVWMVRAGYNVFLYDYRGFGKSGGNLDRRGMIDDVKGAIACMVRRPGVDRSRIVSYGHSLGGAKSLTALGESKAAGVRAVIVEGAFASYRDMAGVFGGQLGKSVVTDDLSPRDYVAKISPTPLLVVHGDQDEIVPVSQARILYKNAHQPKTFFEVKDGHHGDSLWIHGETYRKKVLAWLTENLG